MGYHLGDAVMPRLWICTKNACCKNLGEFKEIQLADATRDSVTLLGVNLTALEEDN